MKGQIEISPKATPQVRQMIQAGAKILFDPSMVPVVKHMIAGADTFVQGAAPFIANLVMSLQGKMGPLETNDEAMLIYHLCGYLVSLVHDLGDPEAKDEAKLTAKLMMAVHNMMVGGKPGQGSPMQQLQPQQAPPQQAPQQPQSPPMGGP